MHKKIALKKAIRLVFKLLLSMVLFVLLLMTGGIVYSNFKPAMLPIQYDAAFLDYWPTQNWRMSTPGEQGMDSGKLIKMIEYYKKECAENENTLIESITIVRNGYVVADIYLNPLFPKETKHVIHSCTKSIMSTLIGIAIEKGYIANVNVPVLDILNENISKNNDERIKNLTLKNLLTMQSGLHSQDSYLYQWRGLFEMQRTDDWTNYILNLPMETEPGIRFNYSNMASFLLSSIITKSTGMSTLSFAQEHLFDPLGIDHVKWEKSPKGIHIGWARMWLKPHDMAKVGLLYLQKGKWEEKQIVPVNWIEESLVAHSFPKKYRYIFDADNEIDYVTSGGAWAYTNLARPFADGYGYQWWLDKSGMYTAMGVGGQFIMVVPSKSIIVVFTSKLSGAESFLPVKMLKEFILPAVVSNELITSNNKKQSQLDSLSQVPSLDSAPKSIPKLPAMAYEITGVTYSLESNPWRYNNFQLQFYQNQDYAEVSYLHKGNEKVRYKIGLDDVYRFTNSNEVTYAAKGTWNSSDTFVIDYEIIGNSNKGKWTLFFDENDITIEEVGVTGKYSYTGKK